MQRLSYQVPYRATWRVVGLCIASMLASACATNRVQSAAVPDAAGRWDAQLLRMVDQRAGDTALVDYLLGDHRPSLSARRARAALAVGQVRLRARYPQLRQLLVDPDTAVAANAAYALGIGRDTAGIPALARAVAGAPDVVAREAAWALGELGEPARLVLAIALGQGQSQPLTQSTAGQRAPAVRAALLLAAARLDPVPVAVVRPWIADSAHEAVRAAAYAFGRPRLAAGVRALLTLQKHPDDETREHVARGLVAGAAGDSLAAQSRQALLVLVTDASARVRMNASRSLATFGPSVLAAYEGVLADTDATVRVAATESARTVFLRDTAAWKRAWLRDTTFRVRQQLLAGARAAGVSVLEDEESAWLRHPDGQYRLAAIDAQSADSQTDRVALAITLRTDSDPRVQARALSLLPASASDSVVRTLAMTWVTSTDAQVRAGALRQLTRHARASDMGVALDAWAQAARDTESDARTAALRLINAAWMQDSVAVDDAARQRLRAFAGTATGSDRRVVANVTPMYDWVHATPAVKERALSEYDALVRQWFGVGARNPRAVIRTDKGDITIELFGSDAPMVVEAFVRLARTGFYRNSAFHRIVPNFVVQDGAANADGSGGPGFTLRESWSRRRHERGAVGLATSGPDTGGSQYYLTHAAQPHLDGAYTVFGRVIDGLDVMDRLLQGDRMLRIDIL